MQDLTGQTIGGYQIVEQIGRGGMATVFRAYQPSLDRDVAIKVLPPYYAEQDESFLERFKREARAIAKLRHPNILMVMDFGQENDLSYIVMEYVNAGTLKDRISTPIQLKEVYELTKQVANALQYAHDQGVVHRDVKPSNIMMPKPDWALLTDFGLARMVGGSLLTQSGMTVGTPAYMSPEQGSGDKIDHRTDIYALGVMLYEMTVGEVPYTAETPMAVVVKHIVDPLPLPRAKNPEIPEDLQRVILKALAKNPNDRFQQISEIPQALEQISRDHPTWSAAKITVASLGQETKVDTPETDIVHDEVLEAGLPDEPTVGILPEEDQAESDPELMKDTVPMLDSAPDIEPVDALEDEISPETEILEAPPKKKRRLWPFIVGGVALLAVAGVGLAALLSSGDGDVAQQDTSDSPVVSVFMPTKTPSDEGVFDDATEESVQRIVDKVLEGDFERADEILKFAIARNPELWNALIARIEQFAGRGDHETAARLLALVLEANPDAPAENFVWNGFLYIDAGFAFEANHAFRKALLREPFLLEAHYMFTETAVQADIVPEAIEFLEGLAEKHPDEYLIYASIGDLYKHLGDFGSAIDAYEKALELEPGNPWVLVAMAEAVQWAGYSEEAAAFLEEAQENMADDPVLMARAGYLYLNMGDHESAYVLFRKAHQLSKDDAWILTGFAKSMFYSGRDVDQLTTYLRSAEQIAKNGRDAWMLNEIGWFYVEMGQCDNALRVFTTAEEIAPGETNAADGIGSCQ